MPTRSLLLAVAALVAIPQALAATYHVAPDGNDANDGSRSSPWRTINQANGALRAGDTVLVASGTYREPINPARSGTGQAPILYRSEVRGGARIASAQESGALIADREHIVIDGFSFSVSPPDGRSFNIDLQNARYVTVENCRLEGAGSISEIISMAKGGTQEGAIRVAGGSDNVLRNNVIERYAFQGVKITAQSLRTRVLDNTIRDTYSDSVRIDSGRSTLQGHLVEGNVLSGSLASDGIQTNADFDAVDRKADTSNWGLIIRDNEIFGHGENGIDLKGTRFVLVEGNEIFGNVSDNDGEMDGENTRYGTPGGIGKGSGASSDTVIIRHNVIHDNNAGTLATNGWKIYNNTFVGNNRDYTGPESSFNPGGRRQFVGVAGDGNVERVSVKNNIFVNHGHAELRLHPDSGVAIDHNLYFNSRGQPMLALQGWEGWEGFDLDSWQNALRALPGMSGFDLNSRVADPKFVAQVVTTHNRRKEIAYALGENSPAIDAGTALTRTASAGSGTSIDLIDAGYFFDGLGIIQGDQIVVGTSQPVRIIDVDYGANRIRIDRSLRWNAGDGVSLPYSGSASDLGALEAGGGAWFAVPEAPTLFSD